MKAVAYQVRCLDDEGSIDRTEFEGLEQACNYARGRARTSKHDVQVYSITEVALFRGRP